MGSSEKTSVRWAVLMPTDGMIATAQNWTSARPGGQLYDQATSTPRPYGRGMIRAPNPADLGDTASWLNQLGHAIVGRSISLLGWRSGGFMRPHDMPLFRFSPSPTSGDSSSADVAV